MNRRMHIEGQRLPIPQTATSSETLRAAKDNYEIFAGLSKDPYVLSVRAFVWGYPFVRAAQIRQNVTCPENPHIERPTSVGGAPINSMGHASALATPETRLGVAPNNDTLYSLAWLDLSLEPYVLECPDFGRRYYTFQFGQADTSTDQSFGQRTHGGSLPPIFIYGPAYQGKIPDGMLGVRGRFRYLMIAGRILVNGRLDLPAVHALQDMIQLRPFSAYRAGRVSSGAISPQRPLVDPLNPVDKAYSFLEMLGAVMRDLDLEPTDAQLMASMQTLGLTQEHGFRLQALTAEQKEAIAQGLADGEAAVRAKTFDLGRNVNGWSLNYVGPRFGGDYLLRAAVAMDQIYILEPQEALYASGRLDSCGKELDGHNTYRIHFAKELLPPVNAFWSITLYYAKGFMVPNEIGRWSIGDRTAGLVYETDGSLQIRIQHLRPDGEAMRNWLPAPKEPFMLLMRLYIPQTQVVDGTWTPPAIEKVE